MKKSKKDKKSKPTKELIELDPIFPIPLVASSLPIVRQGDGTSILHDTKPVIIEVPYRAFFMAWELIEKRAAESYPRYANGSLDHVAKTYLEAIIGFRNAALRSAHQDVALTAFSETEAAVIREAWRKSKLPKKAKKAADDADEAPKGSAAEKTASRDESEAPICGKKHKIDGKTRKCVRKPDHTGKHKDKKGDRW